MNENLNKISSQMRKGVLDFIILSIIENGEVYASDIIDILKKNQLIVVEGTLYPLLSRLKNDKLISYFWVESTGGPPRKYYKLTHEGKNIIKIMKTTWKELENAVNKIIK